MDNVLVAFLMTTIAGLSTGVGSCIAFFAKKDNSKFLAVSLGFSAGVMIYVSLVEIYVKAQTALTISFGQKDGILVAILAFFGGIALIYIIDIFLPNDNNLIVGKSVDYALAEVQTNKQLLHTGLFTAVAMTIHNFPEGLATFVTALDEPTVAVPIVVAIAVHNIPEGIAVSVPIYYATGSKKKAFWYSFASGLSEPVGALIGFAFLMPFIGDTVNGILFASVAGIMVFISLNELLPSARQYGEHKLSIYGLLGGMLLMAVSLWLFM